MISLNDNQVNNRNVTELEMTNATQRAALAAIKEECALVLKERSELLQRIAQLSLNVPVSLVFKLTYQGNKSCARRHRTV